MKPIIKLSAMLMILVSSAFFVIPPCAAQGTNPLLSESFETGSGTTPPAGWVIEQVTGTIPGIAFVSSSVNPAINAAFEGTKFVQYNAFGISSGSTRLKYTTPLSTTLHNYVLVDFGWFESQANATSNDKVEVQWSINGTTWNTAGTFFRYNVEQGWKLKHQWLPAGANNQPTLYVAFLFTSANGNNCALDWVHVTCGPSVVNCNATIGTGTSSSVYPYTTGWMGGRTQMLYTAAELTGAGVSAGNIYSIGFNVISNSPQVMNGFNVKMGLTTATFILNYVNGLASYFSSTYTVPGTGWQDISLTTPFVWNGTSNILVDVCYGNTSKTSNSPVSASGSVSTVQGYYEDNAALCGTALLNNPVLRPNIRFGLTCAKGVVSGYIRDLTTLEPIPGAIVTIGTTRDTTTADGFYALYNLTPGSANVNVTEQCHISGSATVSIVANTVTNANVNLMAAPVVTGMVTDACSGATVAGAKITIGTGASAVITYSGNNGIYLATCVRLVGVQPFTVSKTGYDSFTGTFNLVANTTTIQNAALLCTPVPPENVTAVLDNPVNPISVNLTWSQPQGNYQLIYDDGSQESYSVWAAAGNMHALRFTPLGWPAKVTGGMINIGESSNYPAGALPLTKFKMFVCKADGPGGIPGTLIDSVEVTPASFGWINFSFAAPVTINSGDFYLVMQQGGIPPHACGIGIDNTSSQLRSWSRFVSGSGPWVPVAGNYMMRAVVKGTGGPVLTDEATFTPSYQVWRFIQGQETNPAQWTSVYTGNLNAWTDNAWFSLPCNAYRWAVKAVYPPGQRVSAPAFSNVLGKCWTSTVTIQTTTDCGLCGKNVPVLLTNNLYPDTNYRIPLDSLGHGQLSGIWKGNYHLTFAQFTCELVVMNNVPVFGDTTITFNIAGVRPPPTDLSINEQSLVATWNAPRVSIDLFNEKWATGNFTFNQWVVTGGNNWQISNTLGYPAPSAMFSWSPQCTNCSQYLTSKTIQGYVAPVVVLNYDLYLDNFNTTSICTLAVEIWNGTTWSVLKTYDNQWGSIPWTSEVLDITNVASHDFKIRFHASSQDTYSINSWNVDNISVVARDHPTPPECLLGYNFYLNNTLALFTYDTSYHIPPQQVIYGQKYQACARAVYTGGYSSAICDSFTCKYLYPPKNLSVTPVECAASLSWEKPDDPVALSALMGYDIYRDWTFVHYNSHPDSVNYDDLNLNPGSYLYRVRSKYDLGIYGFPGQVGESLFLSDTGAVTVQCGFPIPFHEGWDQGNFSFHSWTFEPDQGNWDISTFIKSTAPFADFHWQPVRTNYSYAMESDAIDASGWKCAKLWLDFDYKLTDHHATGNEKLKVEAWYNNGWHLLQTLSNNGSVDWTTLHLDLSAASGKGLKIRFVAYGVNSGDILHWYIDNINVYGVCLPPSALTYTMSGQMVNLSWTAPACNGSQGPAGYNVFRTDSTGLPPFFLRNPGLVSGTSYSDDTGPGVGGMYYYFVTAVFNDPVSLVPLCESAGTDTIVISTVGTSEKINHGPWVFPNPATGSIQVKSDRKIVLLEMLDYSGNSMVIRNKPDTYSLSLDVSAYPSGIYFIRVTDQQVTKIIKVVVAH